MVDEHAARHSPAVIGASLPSTVGVECTAVRSVRKKGQRWRVMRERLGFAMVWRAILQHLRSRCKFTIGKPPSKFWRSDVSGVGVVPGAKPHLAGRMWDLVARPGFAAAGLPCASAKSTMSLDQEG